MLIVEESILNYTNFCLKIILPHGRTLHFFKAGREAL
jgi:hypothetical protein